MQPLCRAPDEVLMLHEGLRFVGISSEFRERIPNSENEHGTYRGYADRGKRVWEGASSQVYLQAELLLSCADSGSSNSYRVRPWKVEV